MAQYTAETAHAAPAVSSVADPIPLGMSAFAFTTAILGCTFAGFILPGVGAGISLVVAAALFYGGIVQILAGMWEFRKDNTIAATIFSAYGGFLVAFGVVFLLGSASSRRSIVQQSSIQLSDSSSYAGRSSPPCCSWARSGPTLRC